MFRLRGVSPPPLLVYRGGIAILLLLLLYSHLSHRAQLEKVTMAAKEELEACHANSESIFSKLTVIYEHKKKMEQDSLKQRNATDRKIFELQKTLSTCHSERDKAKQRIVEMEKATMVPAVEKLKVGPEELLQLQKKELERLQKRVEDQTLELEKRRKEVESLGQELEDCRRTVKQHALPVAHYTQNETAFFNRKHKQGGELSFDRGAIEQHRGNVLPGAVLMQRLEEKRKKAEETEVHPDDRNEKDDYVHEQQDTAEEDYKEHPQ